MAKPYTIRIFIADGDPDGLKVVDQMNWTGKALAFPRHKWPDVRNRKEFWSAGAAVYVLLGYAADEDPVPRIYVGQGDVVGDRLDEHIKNKKFWERGVVFVSTNSGLNKAHTTWLEHALVKRAVQANGCLLDNATEPKEPPLSEPERADTEAFFAEVLRILPVLGIHAFEISSKPVSINAEATKPSPQPAASDEIDTVVVPAYEEGFKKVFLGQNCWYEIRIASERLDKIKYIAAYQTWPVCSITHFASVHHIEPYGDSGKYKLVFAEPAQPLPSPVPFGDAPQGSMQGIRYTTLKRLKAAKQVTDLSAKSVATTAN